MIRWLWVWGPAVAQMAAIFALSSWSNVPDLPGGLSSYTGHMIGYALLGVLAVRAFAHARWREVTRPVCWRALGLATAYGITDEVHQAFVSTRFPSFEDWVADVVGATIGVLLVAWIARVRVGRSGDAR